MLTAGRCTAHGPCCWTPNRHVWYFWLFWVLFAVCGGKWVRSWEEASYVQSLWEDFPAPERHSVKHLMAPFACRPVIQCGKSGCTGSCPLSVVEYGYKAGRKPATCRTCGKTFPRPNVTLSDFFTVKSDKKKGNNSRNVSPVTSRRSRNTSPAMYRRSSVVSWSDSPRDQAVPKSEDAVMEDCTESHQTWNESAG